jgi:hypothetical protein
MDKYEWRRTKFVSFNSYKCKGDESIVKYRFKTKCNLESGVSATIIVYENFVLRRGMFLLVMYHHYHHLDTIAGEE